MRRIALALPECSERVSRDLGAKEALLADDPAVFFTTPHFDGHPAVLVRMERIALDELEELIVEACLTQAPKRVAKQYVESRFGGPDS